MVTKQVNNIERQRMWARWYARARNTYEQERERRDVKIIDWRELPLIPHPDEEKET